MEPIMKTFDNKYIKVPETWREGGIEFDIRIFGTYLCDLN
jgi:hypothetical protein